MAARTAPPPSRRKGSGGSERMLRFDKRQARPLVLERRSRAKRGPGLRSSSGRRRGPSTRRRSGYACRERSRRTGRDRPRRRWGRPTSARARRSARAGRRRRRPRAARPAVATSCREARIDPASGSDRARAASHQHPPVVRRPEVVEEHPAVADRLVAGPADLLQQLGHRFGQDDVAAEVRQPPRHGAPAGQRRIRGEDDLLRSDPPAGRLEDVRGARGHRRTRVRS